MFWMWSKAFSISIWKEAGQPRSTIGEVIYLNCAWPVTGKIREVTVAFIDRPKSRCEVDCCADGGFCQADVADALVDLLHKVLVLSQTLTFALCNFLIHNCMEALWATENPQKNGCVSRLAI